MIRKLWDAFHARGFAAKLDNPWLRSAMNFTLVSVAYFANQLHQVYCQPVTWAAIALIFIFVPVVFWPLLRERWPLLQPSLQILRGCAFCICLYCIVFIERGNLLLPFMIPFGFGIAGLTPHYFAVLMIYQTFRRKSGLVMRGTFLVGVWLSCMIAGYFVWDFRQAVPIAQELAAHPEPYEGLHAQAVEWILGMHFRYHTRPLVDIDGWRPPLHDPAGVIGFWGIGRVDPLSLKLPERIALYQQVFPDSPIRANCSCAWDHDARTYWSDSLLSSDF